MRAKFKECFGHLLEGKSVVEGRDGDVAAVQDLEARVIGVDAGSWVEGSVW